jgi:hypothetical protein
LKRPRASSNYSEARRLPIVATMLVALILAFALPLFSSRHGSAQTPSRVPTIQVSQTSSGSQIPSRWETSASFSKTITS